MEAELVGYSEYIPYILWVLMFINDRGYLLKQEYNISRQRKRNLNGDKKSQLLHGKFHTCDHNFFIKDIVYKKKL